MQNMYLVRDWTDTKSGEKPHSFVVDDDVELMEIVDNAKKHDYKISIFKIGDCILDWS